MLTGLDISLEPSPRSTQILKDFSHLIPTPNEDYTGLEKELVTSWRRELFRATFGLFQRFITRVALVACLFIISIFVLSSHANAEELRPTSGKGGTVQCDKVIGCRYLI